MSTLWWPILLTWLQKYKYFRKCGLPSWRRKTSFLSYPQLFPDLLTAKQIIHKVTTSKASPERTRYGCGLSYMLKHDLSATFSLTTFVKWPWISLQPKMSFAFLSPICCRPFSSLREPVLRTCRILCLDCSSTDVSSWDSQPFVLMFSLPSGGWERNTI